MPKSKVILSYTLQSKNPVKVYKTFNWSQTLCLFKHQILNQRAFKGINHQKSLLNWQLFNLANSIYQADNVSSEARSGLQKRRKKSRHTTSYHVNLLRCYIDCGSFDFSVLITSIFVVSQVHDAQRTVQHAKMIIRLICNN